MLSSPGVAGIRLPLATPLAVEMSCRLLPHSPAQRPSARAGPLKLRANLLPPHPTEWLSAKQVASTRV